MIRAKAKKMQIENREQRINPVLFQAATMFVFYEQNCHGLIYGNSTLSEFSVQF